MTTESAAEVRTSRAGDCIDARYRLESEIGSGGLGAVYRATQTKLARAVAVKLLNESMGASDVQRARFEREAKALAALEHPNIVSVLDYGVADGQPYFVMELLEGETLAKRLEDNPLPLEAALHIARELLSALGFMHHSGLVHRDLKPSNVFLQRVHGGERVKVLDFGLAKNTGITNQRPDATLTRDGSVVGTPAYMSPEQATGDMVDTRSDVYALGVMLFQMLSGRLPFEGDAFDQVRSHLVEPVPALARAEPIRELDAELEKLIWRAMAKRREDRFVTAAEMRDELNAIISRHQNSAGVPLTAAGRDAPSRPSLRAALPTAARVGAWMRTAWRTFVVGSVLGFVAVLGLLVLLLRHPDDRHALGELGGRAYQRVSELRTRAAQATGVAPATLARPGAALGVTQTTGSGTQATGEPAQPGPQPTAAEAEPAQLEAPPTAAEAELEPSAAQEPTAPPLSAATEPGAQPPTPANPAEAPAANSGNAEDETSPQATPSADPTASPDTHTHARTPTTPSVAPAARAPTPRGDPRVPGPPSAQNPWSRPLPRELRGMHAAIFAGGTGNDHVITLLRDYNQAHAEDPRGRLMLSQLYINRGARPEAVAQVAAALQNDLSARGAPEVLRNLLGSVVQGKAAAEAGRLIVRAYGSEALPTLDARIAATKEPEVVARLRALRGRIRPGP